MKKNLFICLLAFLPFFAAAQEENPPVVNDFYKNTRDIPTSFVLNDHVNIMEFKVDNESFDIVAVNDQMQILWKTTLKGYIISANKFKDKILAVATTDYSSAKQQNNTYKGYILDPSTGKVLIEKIIFDGPQNNLSFPFIFTGENGEFFKFALRQSATERKVHITLGFSFGNSAVKQLYETKDLDIIDFNEKLEPVFKFKPAISDGTFLAMTSNSQADVFIEWFDNGSLKMVKYDNGKSTPSGQIAADLKIDNDILDFYNNDIPITASKKNNNVLYYSLVFKNMSSKEMELGLGKLDFSSGKKMYVNEVFTKDHAKELKKAFVPTNKKMSSPDLGSVKSLQVRALKVIDDHLIVTLSSTSSEKGVYGGTWMDQSSFILNNYDTDLNLKSQQLIPTSYSVPGRQLPTGYYYNKNKLFIIANDKAGATTMYATYCVFDLESGKFDKMYWLSKKKIANSHAAASASVLWFKDSFVVPYLDLKGFSGGKYDIILQKNSY